jgi:hypothetical protein
MTKWQQGKYDDARRMLREIRPAIDKRLETPTLLWHRRVNRELIRNEAVALIEPKEADEAVENKSRPNKESSSNSIEQASHEKK